MQIHLIEKDQASPLGQRIYDALEQQSGSVSTFNKMLAHKPEVLRAFNQLSGALWAEGALSPTLKELAYHGGTDCRAGAGDCHGQLDQPRQRWTPDAPELSSRQFLQGEVFVASASGSQLAAYVFGAGSVIWVVGSQKIVPDREAAFKRIYEYSFPREDERARDAYGIGSGVNKVLIVNREFTPGRITVILVKQELGF